MNAKIKLSARNLIIVFLIILPKLIRVTHLLNNILNSINIDILNLLEGNKELSKVISALKATDMHILNIITSHER